MRYLIHPLDLQDRHVYLITSRNLLVGVWHAATQGFIGLRVKFDSTSLFEEYEYDLAGGTARAIEDLGPLPDVIESRLRHEDGRPYEPLRAYLTALQDALSEDFPVVRVDPAATYRLPPIVGLRSARRDLHRARLHNKTMHRVKLINSGHHGRIKHLRDVVRYHSKRLARLENDQATKENQ